MFLFEIFNILFSYEDEDIGKFSDLHQCTFKASLLETLLGIEIGNKIEFKHHIKTLSNKIPKILGALKSFLNLEKQKRTKAKAKKTKNKKNEKKKKKKNQQ